MHRGKAPSGSEVKVTMTESLGFNDLGSLVRALGFDDLDSLAKTLGFRDVDELAQTMGFQDLDALAKALGFEVIESPEATPQSREELPRGDETCSH